MEQFKTILLFTKGQVKKLKDYLKKEYDMDLRSSQVVVGYDISEGVDYQEVTERVMFRVFTVERVCHTIIKVNYNPEPEVLIGAGIITAEEYRESLL